MNATHENGFTSRRCRCRPPSTAGQARRREYLPLTADGIPAATPDAPRPSPVVGVSGASRARYPWLPQRVIANSVWRGPEHLLVRVDPNGAATPWPHRGGR